MTDDEIDRILASGHDDILPTSGFVESVMEAVRDEALRPPPIPFPWKRALPGLAAAGVALVWVLVVGITQLGPAAEAPQLTLRLPSALAPILDAAAWTVAALLLTLASVKLSMRFVTRRT
jgi:hypothetical protein